MGDNVWSCPVCNKQAAMGDLELHLARKADMSHRRWRLDNKLPERIPIGDISGHRIHIRAAMVVTLPFAEREPVKTKIHEYWDAYHDATGVLKPVALKLKKDILAYCESAGCAVKPGKNLDKHVEAMTSIAPVSLCPWANETNCPCYRMRNEGICKSGLLKKT